MSGTTENLKTGNPSTQLVKGDTGPDWIGPRGVEG